MLTSVGETNRAQLSKIWTNDCRLTLDSHYKVTCCIRGTVWSAHADLGHFFYGHQMQVHNFAHVCALHAVKCLCLVGSTIFHLFDGYIWCSQKSTGKTEHYYDKRNLFFSLPSCLSREDISVAARFCSKQTKQTEGFQKIKPLNSDGWQSISL